MEFRRNGATRWVLITSKLVYKIPGLGSYRQFLTGLLANLQERTFAKTQWPQLCPVYWADYLGLLVVMPYATPLSDREWAETDWQAFLEHDDYCVPAERKRDSFGRYQGRIVAVDYG